MKDIVKKEILFDLNKAIQIIQTKENKDIEELRVLSDHAIEDVASHKDLDLVAVTVLLYSLYKVGESMSPEDYAAVLNDLTAARDNLQRNQFGRYNRNIKDLYSVIRRRHAAVKTHLQDVMQAARIKKGAVLLQKGLSLGQAAGLMGLTNWELQQYAGGTILIEHEAVSAKKRLKLTRGIFGV
jgi:hypothetical protein